MKVAAEGQTTRCWRRRRTRSRRCSPTHLAVHAPPECWGLIHQSVMRCINVKTTSRHSVHDHCAHLRETDCVAGHIGLELRNVVANYPFEKSHRFAGIPPNSGFGDYSRSSCDGGRRSSGLVPDLGRMLALAGIAATFCRCRDDPAAANPAIPLLTLRWTFPARRASVDSICSAERAAMRARVFFISKHRCRLGGDRANRLWPPRTADHSVALN